MVRQICATIAILSIGLLSAFGIQKNSFKDIDMNAPPARQKLLMDLSWKFHLGNAADPEKDFEFGMTAPFSKAGQASGPAIPDFKDSTWRTVDLPHDWASELGFVHVDDRNLDSHGYKPLGRQFPETSIGWYRRSFTIPKSADRKRIAVKFDGVFRDCMLWFNGFFLGEHLSGYSEFCYDITDYVRYGGKNVLAVRVDATQAEGWFYEGAGIYRHVWLLEYYPVHIPLYGTYVTTDVVNNAATVKIRTKIINQSYSKVGCQLVSVLVD